MSGQLFYNDSGDDNEPCAVLITDEGTVYHLFGEDEALTGLPQDEQADHVESEYQEVFPDEEPVDGDIIVNALNATKRIGIPFEWECAICGGVVNADNCCTSYIPTASISSMPETVAICKKCFKPLYTCNDDDAVFGKEFDTIVNSTLAALTGTDGKIVFDIIPVESGTENQIDKQYKWIGTVEELIWEDDPFCKSYRAEQKCTDEDLSHDGYSVYSFIEDIISNVRNAPVDDEE